MKNAGSLYWGFICPFFTSKSHWLSVTTRNLVASIKTCLVVMPSYSCDAGLWKFIFETRYPRLNSLQINWLEKLLILKLMDHDIINVGQPHTFPTRKIY